MSKNTVMFTADESESVHRLFSMLNDDSSLAQAVKAKRPTPEDAKAQRLVLRCHLIDRQMFRWSQTHVTQRFVRWWHLCMEG